MFFHHLWGYSLFLLFTSLALGDILSPKLTGRYIDPISWFQPASPDIQKSVAYDTSENAVAAHNTLLHLLQHPGDKQDILALARSRRANAVVLDHFAQNANEKQIQELAPLVTYHQFVPNNFYERYADPSDKFILRMLNTLRLYRNPAQLRNSLHEWLADDDDLQPHEIDTILAALSQLCQDKDCSWVEKRRTLFYISQFRNRHVVLEPRLEEELSRRRPDLAPFIISERTLHGKSCKYLKKNDKEKNFLLISTLWKNPKTAAFLGKKMHKLGFLLLQQKTDILPDYLSYKGILHYRTYGQDVPDCCLTALQPHLFSSQEEAAAQVKKETALLEPELKALAPRCALACGQVDWEPVEVTANTPSSRWPDTSAVSLPQWTPALLHLEDEKLSTVIAAFDTDLEALDNLFTAVRSQESAGVLLAQAMEECDRVRPLQEDLIPPIYLRIALQHEPDGVTVSFDSNDTYQISSNPGSSNPIVAEALHKAPQHLHRLALELAILEREGKILDSPCARLARTLNRHGLWTLIICQRELRGFSPRALLTLFKYYEGEHAPLQLYGEAMGMEHEMNIASLTPEDELGDNLLRAARISRAIPASEKEREEAITHFLSIAKAHGADDFSQLTGHILRHLVHWGAWEPVAAWKDCPARWFQGDYAITGLRLIRHLSNSGRIEDAQRMLKTMEADIKTDTTPALRLAKAQLCKDKEEAARLRTDALLLAILYHYIDKRIYADYLEEIAEAGDTLENIIRCELLFSWGKSVGITEHMARRYEVLGEWEKAVFAWEYLISIGISTATPYGHIPSQADIYRYRRAADACRKQLGEKRPSPAPEAHIYTQTAKQKYAKDSYSILPARKWELVDGTVVEAKLVGVMDDQHHNKNTLLQLRLPDGSLRLLNKTQLRENPDTYLSIWRAANKIHTFDREKDLDRSTAPKQRGHLVGLSADISTHLTPIAIVRDESNTIIHIPTKGRDEKTLRLIAEYETLHGRNDSWLIADTIENAKYLAAKKNLPILLISYASGNGYRSQEMLNQYINHHPNAPTIWAQKYVIFPVCYQSSGRERLHYPQELIDQLLELEQEYHPDLKPENSQILKFIGLKIDTFKACILDLDRQGCAEINLDEKKNPRKIFDEIENQEKL